MVRERESVCTFLARLPPLSQPSPPLPFSQLALSLLPPMPSPLPLPLPPFLPAFPPPQANAMIWMASTRSAFEPLNPQEIEEYHSRMAGSGAKCPFQH